MRLVIHGPQSLDELQSVVTACFSNIQNKDIEMPTAKADAFGPNELPRWIEVYPESEHRKLELVFPIKQNFTGMNHDLKVFCILSN